MTNSNWRKDFPVLVPDAHAVGAIGVIRSLGAAGYPVHAMDEAPNALGLSSRYAAARAVCPRHDCTEFIPWLREYIRRNGIAAIAPHGIFTAIRPHFREFQQLMPISANEDLVYSVLSKFEVSARLLERSAPRAVSEHMPPTVLLRVADDSSAIRQVEELPYPVFLKTDDLHSPTGKGGFVKRANSPTEARTFIEEIWNDFDRVNIQGFVPGKGAAAAFIVLRDKTRAEFMNLCLHEVPYTGGYCTLRQSWRHERMLDDARLKLQHLGWQGVAMLEYRWERTADEFNFIEINPRFWAALHTALFAGSDLPRILMDAHFSHDEPAALSYRLGIKCRHTFPFELGYLYGRLRDSNLPFASRLWSVLEFFALCLDPNVKADLWFPGDRRLYWLSMKQTYRHYFPATTER